MIIKRNFLIVLFLFFIIKTHASVIYVDSANVSVFQDGSSWTDAYNNLRYAIQTAGSGDSIWVAKGTYTPGSGYLNFSMKSGVRIFGGFLNTDNNFEQRNWENNATILKGSGYTGVIYNNNVGLTAITILNGFTIISSGTQSGGAIRNYASAPLIQNCTFLGSEGSVIDAGGAIHNQISWPTIENCVFINNRSYNYGGAICTNNDGNPNTVKIIKCTFIGNKSSSGGGGAIYCESASVLIDDCIFNNNQAYTGGAVNSFGCYFQSFKNCEFNSNIASGAGGAVFLRASLVKIENCLFQENASTSEAFGYLNGGGGIYTIYNNYFTLSNINPSVNIVKCIFSGNKALTSKGGAICNDGLGEDRGTVITNCSFISDSAKIGGGVYNAYSAPRIINTIFSENVSDSLGGAVFNDTASATQFINCTIAENKALISGGGMYNALGSKPVIRNIILWGNSDGINSNISVQVDAKNSLIQGYASNTTTHLIDGLIDPLFVGTNDFHLQSLSPCIDAGSGTFIPADITKDIEGNDRKIGMEVDMGAYESTFNIVGIRDGSITKKKFTISPNPFREKITLHSDRSVLPTVAMICNLSGNIIKTFYIFKEIESFYLPGLANGVYILKLQNNESGVKLIKE